MSTPQDELDSLLADVPAAPRPRASRPVRGPRPATSRPAAPRLAPAVESAPAPPQSPAAGRTPRTKPGVRLDGVNPQLIDFAASGDFTITSGADSAKVHVPGSRHGGGGALDLRTRDKTPEQIEQAKRDAQARGLKATYERAGEGRATGDHLHLEVGDASPTDELDELLADVPQRDELDELLADVPAHALDAAVYDPLAGVDAQPGEEVVGNIRPRQARINPRTAEWRAQRDARLEAEKVGGAAYRMPVGVGAAPDAVREAFVHIAREVDSTPDKVERWLRERGPVGLYDPTTNKPVEASPDGFATIPAELLGQMRRELGAERSNIGRAIDWATDERRSGGEKLLDVVGGAAGGVADLAKRGHNAAANTPDGVVAATAYKAVGEPVVKAIDAGDSYLMAKAMGYGDLTAQHFAEMTYLGIENPATNPGGELLAHVPLLSSNPRWQKGARAFGSFVLKPSNLVPVPEVSALLKAGKLGRAVEAGGELARRVMRVVGMADRGLVEAAPLGLREGARVAEGVADDALEVIARADDGTRSSLINTRASISAWHEAKS